MEKALVLGKMSHRVPINILEKFRAIEGVKDAYLIFGPYDFYITIETRTKERLERVQIDALNLDQN
jgi:DNA-binding Lrp family transcriptional regulator